MQNSHEPSAGSQVLAIPNGNAFHFVREEEILYCLAEGSYTVIVTREQKKLTVTRTLGVIQNLLDEKRFCRVHQSHLINICELVSFYKGPPAQVEMRNGIKLNVSRAKRKDLMERFIQI